MLAELTNDIILELEDPDFATRTHGARRTHVEGCRGPLCREAERLYGNKRFGSKPLAENADYYALLARVTAWHKEQRQLAKAS